MRKKLIYILPLFLINPNANAIVSGCSITDLERCYEMKSVWVKVDGTNYEGYFGYTGNVITCDCQLTTTASEYRCTNGYYGSSQSCTSCPDGGSSTPGDNTTIYKCYLPVNSTGDDSTGTYKIENDKCYY